jgi:chemotaxis-related protein WspD
LLIFRLGSEWLAMALSFVAEVTSPRPVHRVPHRSNGVLSGLVSLRGQLRLCVSLHGLLGVTPSDPAADPSPNSRLIVIREGLESWAFPAEEVSGVHRVARGSLQKVPSTLANPLGGFGRAVFGWDEGRSVDVLDEPRVFEAWGCSPSKARRAHPRRRRSNR